MGLGVAVAERKGQKIGLYGWFVTSNRTWEMMPTKTEKTNAKESLHLLSTFSLST
jgi:hypothetical protein